MHKLHGGLECTARVEGGTARPTSPASTSRSLFFRGGDAPPNGRGCFGRRLPAKPAPAHPLPRRKRLRLPAPPPPPPPGPIHHALPPRGRPPARPPAAL